MTGTRPWRTSSKRGDAERPAVVVGVAVGVDQGADRPLAAMGAVEGQRGGGGFGVGQGVDDDDAALAFDDRHVGQVDAADLVDTGRDLEQAVGHVQARQTPKAGVHLRRRLLAGEEGVVVEVPDQLAAGAAHHPVRQRRDMPAPGIGEVGRVVEGQFPQHRLVGGGRRSGGGLRRAGHGGLLRWLSGRGREAAACQWRPPRSNSAIRTPSQGKLALTHNAAPEGVLLGEVSGEFGRRLGKRLEPVVADRPLDRLAAGDAAQIRCDAVLQRAPAPRQGRRSRRRSAPSRSGSPARPWSAPPAPRRCAAAGRCRARVSCLRGRGASR